MALFLVHARHVKAVPGRKTDVRDGEWLADLLWRALLTGSFVSEQAQREVWELTRYRTNLVRERTAEASRRQKTSEGVNIALASVATDIPGTSGDPGDAGRRGDRRRRTVRELMRSAIPGPIGSPVHRVG